MTSCRKNELSDILYKYMRDNYLCDVTIITFGGLRISAHSVVLATVSNKLRAAFERTHDGGPVRRPNWGYRLTVEECSQESVQAILQFVYTGSIRINRNKETDPSRTDSNLRELLISTKTLANASILQENDILSKGCLQRITDENLKMPNALEILHAGQKLGLDPTKLANCLKAMMEDGSLNIEDTTPYLLTDEDIILDIVDKDPNTKEPFNLVETMRVTSQMLPFVHRDKKLDTSVDVDLPKTIANASNRVSSNLNFVFDALKQANDFLPKINSQLEPAFKQIRKPSGASLSPLGPSFPSVKKSVGSEQICKRNLLEKNLLSKLLSGSRKVSDESASSNSVLHAKSTCESQTLSDHLPFISTSVLKQTNPAILLRHLSPAVSRRADATSLAEIVVRDGNAPPICEEGNVVETAENKMINKLKAGSEDLNLISSLSQADEEIPNPKNTSRDKQIKFVSSPNRTDLLQTGDVAKPYPCDVCGRSFARRYTALEHRRLHSGEKPYQCDRCGKRFTTCGDLTKHRRSQHGAIKPHVCSICGKEMSTGREVADHKRLHEGGNQCPVCQKTFTRLHNMKEHLRGTHQGYRPFSCPHCDKKFVYSGSLRFHKKQHRLSAQDEMNYKSTSKECLKRGKWTDESKHRCDRCGMKFPLKIDLLEHERSHVYETKDGGILKFSKCDGKIDSQSLKNPPESCVTISDSDEVARFSTSTIAQHNASVIEYGHMACASAMNDALMRDDSQRRHQEKIEVSSIDALQDHVLVDLALSGMIGFGTGD